MTSSITIINNEKVYHDAFNQAFNQGRRAVKSGCAVTESAVPAMTVYVAAGIVFFDDEVVVVAETLDLAIASPVQDRMDLIVVNNTGTVSVIDGTAWQSPTDPRPPWFDVDDYVVLARVFVDDGATEIYDADIKDLRTFFTLTVNTNINKYAAEVFDGTSTITHSLNDSNPIIQVYDENYEQMVPTTIEVIDANNIYIDVTLAGTGHITIVGGRDAAPTGNSDLIPQTNNTYDVGSSSKKWKDAYFAGDIDAGTAVVDYLYLRDSVTADVYKVEVASGVLKATKL